MHNTEIISVSQYLDKINTALKSERARILGEICNLQMYEERSYMYFSVKDSGDQSTVKCFMWKRDYRLSGIELRDGLEVIVSAYPSVYKPNGSLSLQVETVELVGEGVLQLAYEKLKNKLDAEGLFASARKRELPEYPHRIGIITSKSGAVINDFLSNVGKFGFEILFVDSRVEGADATKDLLTALSTLKKKNIDVLVMMRGGGSLESFLAFNNELLVRAVAEFPVPVLTGIGHDKDVSLVALVSDHNVSTPTAVANLLNSSWNGALSSVGLFEHKMFSKFESELRDAFFQIEHSHVVIERRFAGFFDMFRKAEQTLQGALVRIESYTARLIDTVTRQGQELERGFGSIVRRVEENIVHSGRILELSSPERQLARGYSIVKVGDRVVRSRNDVKKGEQLDIMVSDGIIESKVV